MSSFDPVHFWRATALACQAATIALLLSRGPLGVLGAVPLLLAGLWMWRGASRAWALNTLLLPFVTGVALAFRAEPALQALAVVSGAGFLATVLHIRVRAAARRAGA
jgi:uncharacterized membrane protein